MLCYDIVLPMCVVICIAGRTVLQCAVEKARSDITQRLLQVH